MEKWERTIKRLELVREGLHEETIDQKAVLDIALEHLIELCQAMLEKKLEE